MNRWVIFENSPQENNGRFGCSFTVKYRELTGFLNQIPLKLISFVIASAIMLSACGGGGGGGGGSSKTTVSTPFGSVAGQSRSAAAQGKIAAAAIAVPAAGSVTQSSNTNTQSGITTDSVSTTVEYDDNGQIIYTVENGNEWGVDSAASDTRTLNKGRYTDWNFAELYKKLQYGRLWVDVYSDIGRPTGAMPDTDFLAGGIWVYVPDDATSVDDFTFGAFVHGSDPYDQDNLEGLIGEYTYTGDATGVYSVLADERNYFFDADVTLRANFDDISNLGTIEGHIDNVSVDDELVEGNPKLNLGSANIGGDNSGFFKGDTAMLYEGENYTGKWGGQFFGNDDSNPPGSVAGTFGAATSNGANSVLGVYGAGRQH